jgi:hypothetical protein
MENLKNWYNKLPQDVRVLAYVIPMMIILAIIAFGISRLG